WFSAPVPLLNDEAVRLAPFELDPDPAVAEAAAGSCTPPAFSVPAKLPFPLKLAAVPFNAPVRVPPFSCKYRASFCTVALKLAAEFPPKASALVAVAAVVAVAALPVMLPFIAFENVLFPPI